MIVRLVMTALARIFLCFSFLPLVPVPAEKLNAIYQGSTPRL